MIVVVEVLAGIVFFGLIILSVLLHECGHFIPAKIFGVKVTSVNTMNRKGKTRRTRYGMGKRPDTKRAIVTVAEGDRIDIFSGPVA